MERLACTAVFLLIPACAQSQIKAGSIVVFQLVDGKFVVAADSRGGNKRGQSDDYCKIVALERDFVFSAAGGAFYDQDSPLDPVRSWNAFDDAREAANSGGIYTNAEGRGNAVADRWAEMEAEKWRNLYLFHPQTVIDLATKQNGHVITGVVAVAKENLISITARSVFFKDGVVSVTPRTEIGNCGRDPCAFGATTSISEFISMNTARAKREQLVASPEVLKLLGITSARIIRIADLAEAYGQSGEIGGPIDAVELYNDGSIRWLQQKSACAKK